MRLVKHLFMCLVLVGTAMLTTACTAPTKRIVGVVLDSGIPTVIVHPCGAGRLVSVLLVEDATDSPAPSRSPTTSSAGPSGRRGWRVRDHDSSHPVTEVHLLRIPPGWEQTDAKPIVELRRDASYTVYV